ncbi:MerR family transcriptional regulator [Paucibacter sp. Y2R2-4]|uniref:MerR family transcriptional regulator n=1 Tax=Paucibacter sp. Y2R2-4 TaxID=2893553 RepID=UPI0021E429A9|nr:MerR family transcriptional regulator [Paucibacter sp. Y2R2-4]MCV2349555.1 MerR family transcriptional regulator [Paucibacter sp. Y2R2-4]
MEIALPAIPAKRYFTIGEVSDLCGVKPYVLRYWEQEFTQLKPMKRRGNRRYYQHHEVLLIRRIRGLLYDQGFTISGARNQLLDGGGVPARGETDAMADLGFDGALLDEEMLEEGEGAVDASAHHVRLDGIELMPLNGFGSSTVGAGQEKLTIEQVRAELISIRDVLLA